LDLSAEEPGDLSADGEPEAGAAILPAGGAVRLLEGLEDELLFVLGDADSGVDHREPDHLGRAIQRVLFEFVIRGRTADSKLHATALGELEGVRQEILDDLLQTLWVGVDVGWSRFVDDRFELETSLVGHRLEASVHK